MNAMKFSRMEFRNTMLSKVHLEPVIFLRHCLASQNKWSRKNLLSWIQLTNGANVEPFAFSSLTLGSKTLSLLTITTHLKITTGHSAIARTNLKFGFKLLKRPMRRSGGHLKGLLEDFLTWLLVSWPMVFQRDYLLRKKTNNNFGTNVKHYQRKMSLWRQEVYLIQKVIEPSRRLVSQRDMLTAFWGSAK